MFWTHWINENPQILICNLPLLKPFKGCATATKNSPILIQTNLYWYKPSIYPPGVLGPLIFPIKNLLANFPLPTPFFFSLRQYADVLGNTVFSRESLFLKSFFIGKGWLKGTAHMVAPSNRLLAPVSHPIGPLRKHMFTCDWCISIHCVCSCLSRFVWFVLVIALFWEIIDQFSLKIFLILFLFLARIKQCLPPALDKNSTPPIIAVSFAIPDQSRVILSFVFTGQAGWVFCIVINTAPDSNNWHNRKTYLKFANAQREIQRIWL